jgi:predicted GIY-YIG superfamily endonuclease
MQETKTLYRFYDKNQVLLYVGITSSWRNRIASHKRNSFWYQFVDQSKVETIPADLALKIESSTIWAEKPIFNLSNNFANKSIQYLKQFAPKAKNKTEALLALTELELKEAYSEINLLKSDYETLQKKIQILETEIESLYEERWNLYQIKKQLNKEIRSLKRRENKCITTHQAYQATK